MRHCPFAIPWLGPEVSSILQSAKADVALSHATGGSWPTADGQATGADLWPLTGSKRPIAVIRA